jgi:hypothetical protein
MFKGYKQDRFGVVDGIITCNCNLWTCNRLDLRCWVVISVGRVSVNAFIPIF